MRGMSTWKPALFHTTYRPRSVGRTPVQRENLAAPAYQAKRSGSMRPSRGRTVTYKQDRTEWPSSRDGVGLRVAPPLVPAFADARQPGPAGQTGKCTDSDRRGQVHKNPPRLRSGVSLPRKPADARTAVSALRPDARPPILVSGTIRRRACGVSQGRSSGARAGCHRMWSACPHARAVAY